MSHSGGVIYHWWTAFLPLRVLQSLSDKVTNPKSSY